MDSGACEAFMTLEHHICDKTSPLSADAVQSPAFVPYTDIFLGMALPCSPTQPLDVSCALGEGPAH